jgi:hypothetical protein
VRAFSILSLIALVLVASSCGGSSKSSSSPTAPVSPTAASTAERTARPASATSTPVASSTEAVEEVTGIVGSISQATHIIQIDRLSGARVVKIAVDSSTVLRRAGGDTITLGDVHISDRIVASGHLNDRQDTLVATLVTVQDVLPGAGPGG